MWGTWGDENAVAAAAPATLDTAAPQTEAAAVLTSPYTSTAPADVIGPALDVRYTGAAQIIPTSQIQAFTTAVPLVNTAMNHPAVRNGERRLPSERRPQPKKAWRPSAGTNVVGKLVIVGLIGGTIWYLSKRKGA